MMAVIQVGTDDEPMAMGSGPSGMNHNGHGGTR